MNNQIAIQNDIFRKTPASIIPGKRVMTSGVADLGARAVQEVLELVERFDGFDDGNDPYGERDFGAVDHPTAGRCYWKIDYYDTAYEYGSEDPGDLKKTRRVMTIMLAEEY